MASPRGHAEAKDGFSVRLRTPDDASAMDNLTNGVPGVVDQVMGPHGHQEPYRTPRLRPDDHRQFKALYDEMRSLCRDQSVPELPYSLARLQHIWTSIATPCRRIIHFCKTLSLRYNYA